MTPLAASALAGFLTFPSGGRFLPADKLYVPAHLSQPAPLMVVLHGCQQDADAMAALTRFNALADKEGFLVLYPNQQLGRNPYNCWNWFLGVNQAPGLGEPGEIATAILAAEMVYPIDPKRVHIAGLSAGAAEAATMLACYPDLFAGGAIHSGVPYGLAADAQTAFSVMKDGPGSRTRFGLCNPASYKGKLLVIQGSADTIVNPANADRLASDFSGAGVKKVVIDGLGHAWSGGPAGKFGDPEKPDATALLWSYLSR